MTVLVCLLPSWLFAQSNGSSLTDAAQVPGLVGSERQPPKADCRQLRALGGTSFAVISADPVSGLCRVHALIPQEIQLMLELPDHWNGRLYVLGNGGYAGESVIGDYGQVERGRAHALGFATVFSNLGHDNAREPGTSWARNSFAKKIDYGLRALHVTTLAAKQIVLDYYGTQPHHSYFDGCSTGGGQALKAAQRFPDDYDGIVGGAPVFDFVELQLYGLNNQLAVARTPLSRELVARLGQRIMELYDARDGVADGVIENPLAIDFDPARDLPRASPGHQGFTDAEVSALAQIYAGLRLDGRHLAPGVPVGAEPAGQMYSDSRFSAAPPESGWATRLIPDAKGYMQQRENVESWLKYLAFEIDEPDMSIFRFDPRRDVPRLGAMSTIMDATNPDLSLFAARGGKMLIYHGWADTGVNPLTTVHYYDRVRQGMGAGVADFFRLFMVPGMFHCRGGLGTDRFDALSAIIAWVESNKAPESLLAARVIDGKQVRTRPLCPYPRVAHYRGTGSTDDARNFSCQQPTS
ncbi:MAG: tannase/feruloyl esterase family alpha/beta hydrolase [Proteobacteria bacterium]|nr:tannase/feruloyl esterase family alpha/beta hydrolase [Pseudomonadota bacterium]